MNWPLLAAVCAVAVVSAVPWVTAPEAHAGPLCEHRTAAHFAEHGGRLADDAYHVSHGELPACDSETGSTAPRPADEHPDQGNDRKSRYCRTHIIC